MAAFLRATLLLAVLTGSTAFDFGDVHTPVQPDAHAQVAAQPLLFEEESKLVMEHALVDGPNGERVWSRRSSVTYREATRFVSFAAGQVASVQLGPVTLEGPELEAFARLVEQGKVYSVRIPSVLTDPNSAPIVASVPACALLRANFVEAMQVQLDTAGRVLALSYALPAVGEPCAPGTWKLPSQVVPRPSVSVRTPLDLPTPRMRVEAPGKGTGGRAKGGGGPDGEEAPPKSFLQRYWMYIVPLAVMMLLQGGEPPPAEAKKGGGEPKAAIRAKA